MATERAQAAATASTRVAVLQQQNDCLVSEVVTERVEAAAVVQQLLNRLKQEFNCRKAYPPGHMEQKDKENQELVVLGQRERAAAAAAAVAAEQERAAAVADAKRAGALLAETDEKVEELREEHQFEVAAREAAEDNTKRLQALLAKAEKVHPASYNLYRTPHTLHPTP